MKNVPLIKLFETTWRTSNPTKNNYVTIKFGKEGKLKKLCFVKDVN